jgi:phage/plasmid-associated DNA primase
MDAVITAVMGYDTDEVAKINANTNARIRAEECRQYQDLITFISAERFRAAKGSEQVNVINPNTSGGCYQISNAVAPQFFRLLEECRRQGITANFAEKQHPDGSGIMLDLDIDQEMSARQITDDHITDLVSAIMDVLYGSLETTGQERFSTYVGVMRSTEPRFKPTKDVYRDSIHILIPGVKISRAHKKYFVRELETQNIIKDVFAGLDFASWEILDTGSASVPVYFLGSCKPKDNKTPDPIEYFYQVRQTGRAGLRADFVDADFEDANLCYEFSLNFQPTEPVIRKYAYTPSSLCEADVRELIGNDHDPLDNIENEHGEMSMLMIHDPEARRIRAALKMLAQQRVEDYNMWRKVIYVLASQSHDYRDMAIEFSKRSTSKWNQAEFDRQWTECCQLSKTNPYEPNILYYWAKEDSPTEYHTQRNTSAYKKLMDFVCGDIGNDGEIGHYQVAQLLHLLFGMKYKSHIGKNEKSYTWYEFILPEDKHQPGELFKWRVMFKPASLEIYISEVLPKIYRKALQYFADRITAAETKEAQSRYKNIFKKLSASRRKLDDDGYKKRCISQAETIFNDVHFVSRLDNDEYVLGVANGILLLGEKPKLIDHYHSYAISRSTTVDYRPYDPDNPAIQRMEHTLRNLFLDSEQDSYEFVMCYLASALDTSKKEPLILLLEGGGGNGKSTMGDAVNTTLGEDYSAVHSSQLLTQPLGRAEGANPAVMKMEHSRFNLCDEVGQESINELFLKQTLAGRVSSRALYGSQRNFDVRGRFMATSNYHYKIKSNDHGTWRRIKYLTLKLTFTDPNDPVKPYDPNDPRHRIRDPGLKEFVQSVEAQEAMLSILVKWYVIYQRVYGGNLSNVPHPTIKNETEEFRNSQDDINLWINTQVVICRDQLATRTSLIDFITQYEDWYRQTIADVRINKADVQEKIKNSKLAQYYEESHGHKYILGHKPLKVGQTPQETQVFVGEYTPDVATKYASQFKSVDHRMTLEDYITSRIAECRSHDHIVQSGRPPVQTPTTGSEGVESDEEDVGQYEKIDIPSDSEYD